MTHLLMKQLAAPAAEKLQGYMSLEAPPSALIGFDGYVDKLVRLKRSQNTENDFYPTIASFAEMIGSMGAMSADIALHRIYEKVGGNGPLLADALARKGVPSVCIGAMGYPELNENYRELSGIAELISVADTAHSLVMEFNDGKLMFGDSEQFDQINWSTLTEKIGAARLLQLFSNAGLVGFANWSGLPCADDLLNGIIRDIIPKIEGGSRYFFFDLADPSAKSEQQYQNLFSSMERLRSRYKVTLGLNAKECLLIYNSFFHKNAEIFEEDMLTQLAGHFPADEIVIHVTGKALVGTKDRVTSVQGLSVEKPVISVGAGDNFNSGYCLGLLAGMEPEECALMGNLAAYWFVSHGAPAAQADLQELLKHILQE